MRFITFSDHGIAELRTTPAKLRQLLVDQKRLIESKDGKLLSAFVTLGEFDVVSIVEAQDELHMHEIDDALRGEGYYTASSVGAIPIAEFLETVMRSPHFLSSWMDGREKVRAELMGP